MKKNVVLVLLVIILVFGFIGCGDQCDCGEHDCNYNPEPLIPNQNAPIVLFGGRTVNVSGNNLTNTEWNYALLAIESKINAYYATLEGIPKAGMEAKFDEGVTIILEKNPQGYDVFKTVGYTLYVNVDKLNQLNARDIHMYLGTDHTAKVAPQVTPQLNRQAIAFQNIKEKTI